MKKINYVLMYMLISLFLLSTAAQAQDEEEEQNPDVAVIWSMTAVDGKSQEFEAAVKAFHEFMADKEGHWNWEWYSVLTGEGTGTYMARSGGHDWADMDAEHDWDKEVGAYFDENLAPLIEKATRQITVGEDEFVNWPEDFDEYNYFRLTDWYIKPGQGQAFESNLKKIHNALQEGGWGGYYYFAYNSSGGNANSMTLVTPHKNWADMEAPEPSFFSVLNDVMGEEEAAATMAAFGETYKAGDVTTLRWRKEMNGDD